MDAFQLVAIFVVTAGLFSFINYLWLKLPSSIGVMLCALALSLLLLAAGNWAPGVRDWATHVIGQVQLGQVVLHGMLAFLLFAGGLHIRIRDLGKRALPIGLLALVGTVASAFMVGYALFYFLHWIPLAGDVPLLWCLLFGALISPTDPIAVLAIMRKVGAPKELETVITGESLFNDGVAVVLFMTLLGMLAPDAHPTARGISLLLLREAGGGAAFGLATGFFIYELLRRVDDYEVEIFLTLALATGSYAGAEALGLSAPIAVVAAALVIGNRARDLAMSDRTRQNLNTFWGLIDSMLNAVLFLLIGVQGLTTSFLAAYWLVAAIALPIVLVARAIAVVAVGGLMRLRRGRSLNLWAGTATLTWGGLRGGISVALALSLPDSPQRPLFVAVTYLIVVFAMCVQGLTVAHLIRALYGRQSAPRDVNEPQPPPPDPQASHEPA